MSKGNKQQPLTPADTNVLPLKVQRQTLSAKPEMTGRRVPGKLNTAPVKEKRLPKQGHVGVNGSKGAADSVAAQMEARIKELEGVFLSPMLILTKYPYLTFSSTRTSKERNTTYW
jgi:hypothetical protein